MRYRDGHTMILEACELLLLCTGSSGIVVASEKSHGAVG